MEFEAELQLTWARLSTRSVTSQIHPFQLTLKVQTGSAF
jgi:hypothetical protein